MELPLLKLLSKKSNCWLENTKKQLTFFFLNCFISIDKKHCKKKSNKFTVYHILLTWTSLKRRKTCDTLFRGNFFGKLCKRVLFIYSSPDSSSFLVFFFFSFICTVYMIVIYTQHLLFPLCLQKLLLQQLFSLTILLCSINNQSWILHW